MKKSDCNNIKIAKESSCVSLEAKSSNIRIKKYHLSSKDGAETAIETQDNVCIEAPLEIRIQAQNSSFFKSIAVVMRSPGNDKELATGFLFTEGIIRELNDIISTNCNESIITFTLSHYDKKLLESITRNIFTSSSCGICSKTNLQSLNIDNNYLPWTSKFNISSAHIYGIKSLFLEEDSLFHKTGGNHAAVLMDYQCNAIFRYEDVGRHNAMDKLIGHALLNNTIPFDDKVIVVSGRISFELVQKASMAGAVMIIALGAPTDFAIEEAYAQNICLIGFAKDYSFNVYTAFDRVK